MQTEQELKELIRQKYNKIALQDKETNAASCCDANSHCSNEVYNIMSEDYTKVAGYNADADLGLGCGLPVEFARIKPGDVVIDLGSGAGNDCFIARTQTGETGKVIGIDFTEAMIAKARANAEKMGYNNIEFRLGDIEQMPVNDKVADVVVSNCVLNLLPNKQKVIKEIFRILKANGHFSIYDIVLVGTLPQSMQRAAEMYAGCISGAIQKDEYMQMIKEAGFDHIAIQKEKAVFIPDDILNQYMSNDELTAFRKSEITIYSITVYGRKPDCCIPGSGCC